MVDVSGTGVKDMSATSWMTEKDWLMGVSEGELHGQAEEGLSYNTVD